ncbi:MAG: hypothetical protein Q7U76_12985 [Nitrospirota bacterium]|nr:hypothetical protein [Nitrospirota bacterium]
MTTDHPTVTLRNGVAVLAKLYKGELCPIRYANRTQADTKVKMMPERWYIYRGMGRPFYVALVRA